MLTNRKANNTNLNTTRKTRTLTFSVIAAVALFATACGNDGAPEANASAGAPTETVLVSALPTNTTIETDPTDTVRSDDAQDDVAAAPKPAKKETASTPAAPAQKPSIECTSSQFPSLPYASVVNITTDDADGGLNVRSTPGTSGAKIGKLSSGAVVATSFHADVKCATDAKGGVWWYVYGSDVHGWAHTGFLAEQADEYPIVAPAPDATPEQDVTTDCATIPGAPNCVGVTYLVDGSILVEVTPDTDTVIWAQTACIYGGHQLSCDILSAIGQSDPGNGFFQAPTEFLVADCDAGDPSTEPLVAMACAELATRG